VIRTRQLAARRVRQTLRFENGPRILFDLASSKAPWGRDELVFRLPDNGVVHCPNQPGARVPVYEVFSEDAYRMTALVDDLPDDLVALDIGGHIGCFSLALARTAPGARIHTYEASPSTTGWLSRNVTANRLDAQVTVHQQAVSDSRGTLEFADNAGGSSLNGLTAPEGSTALVQVPAVTVEDAIADAGGRVDLVKIDTEGAEYAMLSATTPATWATVQRVVIEYHNVPGHSWAELEALFAAAGLHVVRHEQLKDADGNDYPQGTVWLSRES
jgi:FkbM family methyltransferase